MPSYYANPSVSFPFLAGLFGQATEYRHGANRLSNPAKNPSAAAGGLFGSQAATDIGNYLTLGGDNAYTSALGDIGRTGNFQGLPEELRNPYYQATGNLDRFIGESQPIVSAMIQNGMPVDIGSLVTAAQSRFNNQFIPQALEQYNPATGSGFANIAAREANQMGTELGQLDYAAQEAARQRQQWGVSVGAPAIGSLSTARLALPGAVLQELQGLSETSDPGGRLLATLLSLLGSTQQPSDAPTASHVSKAGGWLENVGGAVGSLTSIGGILGQ